MEELKKTDFAKLEAEMKKLKPEVEKSMQEAKIGMQKAKTELQEYKAFVAGLDEQGLINKKQPYTIEHKNSQLRINGKAQPADVYNKYRSFLQKHKNFTLKKEADDFNIDVDWQ